LDPALKTSPGLSLLNRAIIFIIVLSLTTVGYGDVYPVTVIGNFFGAVTAVVGIGLIAMPTGILAASFSDAIQTIKKNHEDINE